MYEILKKLSAPFPANDIEWRAGSTNRDKTRALALAYITSRAVMNRLDEVVGPQNWKDNYVPGPNGGVMCLLSVRFGDEWITKAGIADNTQFEAIKGGESDSLKRAAVKFGIGRYLYNLPAKWVACEARGKTVALTEIPDLPTWALPEPGTRGRKAAITRKKAAAPAPKPAAPPPVDEIEDLDSALPEGKSGNGDYSGFVIPLGKNKGKKLSEVSRKAIEWYANEMSPSTDKAKSLQSAAKAYLEALVVA